MRNRGTFATLLLTLPAPQTSVKPIEQGQKAYAKSCAVCHGEDAGGTDQGPKLAGSRRVRSRSTAQLRSFVYDGVPSSDMPAFHLPAAELDGLAGFFGNGQCASCHMVRGRGKAVGPDLSNVAREMTLGEIRQVLLHPDARITPGYELVSVQLRDGSTDFDIQLQSLMKPLTAAPEELRDLIAWLCKLTGVSEGVAHAEMAIAGGLVFYGDPNGAFAAADDRHGKPLWHLPTNVYMKASPMTLMVEGKQYVATVAGPNILCFGLPSKLI